MTVPKCLGALDRVAVEVDPDDLEVREGSSESKRLFTGATACVEDAERWKSNMPVASDRGPTQRCQQRADDSMIGIRMLVVKSSDSLARIRGPTGGS